MLMLSAGDLNQSLVQSWPLPLTLCLFKHKQISKSNQKERRFQFVIIDKFMCSIRFNVKMITNYVFFSKRKDCSMLKFVSRTKKINQGIKELILSGKFACEWQIHTTLISMIKLNKFDLYKFHWLSKQSRGNTKQYCHIPIFKTL